MKHWMGNSADSVRLGRHTVGEFFNNEYHSHSGGVQQCGWPVHVRGHSPLLWPMTGREWPTLDVHSETV